MWLNLKPKKLEQTISLPSHFLFSRYVKTNFFIVKRNNFHFFASLSISVLRKGPPILASGVSRRRCARRWAFRRIDASLVGPANQRRIAFAASATGDAEQRTDRMSSCATGLAARRTRISVLVRWASWVFLGFDFKKINDSIWSGKMGKK